MEELRPNTLDHFRYWTSLTTLDNGEVWDLEEFQCEIVVEVFRGYREVLAVLPTGSYKTTTFGGLGLYHMQFTPGAKVPLGAAAKPQAAILYEQASGFVTRSKWLQRRFSIKDGTKSIVGMKGTPLAGRWMRVYSASDDTGDGIIPTLPMLDELHRHKGNDLYGTWRDKLTKTNGTMVVLSTAGDTEDNPLEVLREAAKRLPDVITIDGRHTIARSKDKGFVMHEWALRKGDDLDDLELVKLANPAKQVTLEELKMRRDSPSTKLWQWARFTCNVRTKGENSAIEPEFFDEWREDGIVIGPTVPTYLGLDLGWRIDHTGITPVGWESSVRRIIASPITLAPPVDEDDIVRHLLMFCWLLDVRGIVYDPNAGGEQMVQQLEKGTHHLQTDENARAEAGLPSLAAAGDDPLVFIEHSQNNEAMSLASVRFDEAFSKGWFRHDGSSKCATPGCRCGGFRGHATNAVTKTLGGEKWKYDRPADAKGGKRKKYPIDGLTGAEFANSIAVQELGSGEKMNLADYRIRRV